MILNPSPKKLALGCAALVAALLLYRWSTETPAASFESPSSSAFVASAGAPERANARRSALEFDAQSAVRAPGTVTAPRAESKASALAETLFHGRLLGPSGQPLGGSLRSTVSLVDADGRRHPSAEREPGEFAFSALPYGKYWFTASADGYLELTDEIELDAAHAQFAKDYTLAAAPILKIRVVTPAGANLFDEELQIEERPALVAIATRELPGKWIDQVVGSLGNPYGSGRFFQSGPRVDSLPGGYMGILMLDQELPAFVSLVNVQRVVQTQAVKAGDDVVTFVLTADEVAASLATIRSQDVDAITLAPTGGSRTILWGGGFIDRALDPDPNSRIVFTTREPAPFDQRVGSAGSEQSRPRLVADSVAAEQERSDLDQQVDLEISVVDSTGAPRNAAFTLGIYDPLSGTMKFDQESTYVSTGAGELDLLGLGHHVYVLRTADDSPAGSVLGSSTGAIPQGDATWVSGNVLLDLRPRSAPSEFVVTLTRATRVMLFTHSERTDGLGYRVTDDLGLELASGNFYGNGPRPVYLPQGPCSVALLDASGQVLSLQSMTVGTRPLTVALTH